jgi:ABC-type multidrug transport system ATPase subunit
LGCLPWKQADDNADAALARVSLSRQANDPAKSLSGGQLRRLGIAQSLARNGTDCCWMSLLQVSTRLKESTFNTY